VEEKEEEDEEEEDIDINKKVKKPSGSLERPEAM